MAKASAAEARHIQVVEEPRVARELVPAPASECYLPAMAGLRVLSRAEIRTVEQVRAFVRGAKERALLANRAHKDALERIRATSLAECSSADRAAYFRGERAAEHAARELAAVRFGLVPSSVAKREHALLVGAVRVQELEETVIPGDGRVRPAQRDAGDADFWDHQRRRIARGDYEVQPSDVADTPLGAARRELLAAEDERDALAQRTRRAEARLHRSEEPLQQQAFANVRLALEQDERDLPIVVELFRLGENVKTIGDAFKRATAQAEGEQRPLSKARATRLRKLARVRGLLPPR